MKYFPMLVLLVLVTFSTLCLYQPDFKAVETPSVPSGYVKAVVSDLQVELTRGMVSLSDAESNTTMDIYVSREQGENLYAALHNLSFPRPLSHDLFLELLEKSGMKVSYVSIDRLEDGIYYATMVIKQNGSMIALDARPSDGIVLALKAGVPIYVHKKLLEEHGGKKSAPEGGLKGSEV